MQLQHHSLTHAAAIMLCWATTGERQDIDVKSIQGSGCITSMQIEHPAVYCRRQWDRWFMMGSIGMAVGIIGYLLFCYIDLFAAIKYRVVR